MAYMAVPNPFVRGERERSFLFNVAGIPVLARRPVDNWTQQRRVCASVQALTVVLRAAFRDNDLIATDWAFDTPAARSAALVYIMDRVMQYRDQDVRNAVYSHRGHSKTNATFLRCIQVHRVLANLTMRTGTTASVSMAALGHRTSPLWADVRGWIVQWIDDSIAGNAPETVDVGWVRAKGANLTVRNPIVRGDAPRSFRIDAGDDTATTVPGTKQPARTHQYRRTSTAKKRKRVPSTSPMRSRFTSPARSPPTSPASGSRRIVLSPQRDSERVERDEDSDDEIEIYSAGLRRVESGRNHDRDDGHGHFGLPAVGRADSAPMMVPEPKLCLSTTNSICIFIDDEDGDDDDQDMSGPEIDASIGTPAPHLPPALETTVVDLGPVYPLAAVPVRPDPTPSSSASESSAPPAPSVSSSASAPLDTATVSRLATALVAALPDNAATRPSSLDQINPALSALHRVLPYVAEFLAASTGGVSEMAMHAAGVYAFQGIPIDLFLATLDDFAREIPAWTFAGYIAELVVQMHVHPEFARVRAIGRQCAEYAANRRWSLSVYRRVLGVVLPVMAEVDRRIEERVGWLTSTPGPVSSDNQECDNRVAFTLPEFS
ncbi:hypothetical protein GGF32_005722 [Allomyces javanicus]|nr:hypothetical protein GGF32_005722 [Allomyces javanicus]